MASSAANSCLRPAGGRLFVGRDGEDLHAAMFVCCHAVDALPVVKVLETHTEAFILKDKETSSFTVKFINI